MKQQQKLTPKYWIGHNTLTDDVFIDTMFKHRADVYDAMVQKFGEEWEDTHPHFEIQLFEIKEVQL